MKHLNSYKTNTTDEPFRSPSTANYAELLCRPELLDHSSKLAHPRIHLMDQDRMHPLIKKGRPTMHRERCVIHTCIQIAEFTLQPNDVDTALGESPSGANIRENAFTKVARGRSSAITTQVRTLKFSFQRHIMSEA